LWSFIDEMTSDPSGSHPSPEGWASTSATTVSVPSVAMRDTVCR